MLLLNKCKALFLFAIIFALLALCGGIFAQGAPPYIGKWGTSGGFIFNKKGDSLAFIAGTDTVWFSANVFRRGLDTVSTLGPTIEGDELGTGLMDSVTAAYDSSQEGYLNPADANVDTAGWNAAAAGGEANTLGDTGTFNETEGFGLAGGKTGTVLKVKGLIEGSNITIAKSGDSGLAIAASGAGLTYWTEGDDNDTSVFTATGPNTTVGLNDGLTMQGNDISGVAKLTVEGSFYADDGVGNSPLIALRDADNKDLTLLKYDAGFGMLSNNEAELRFIFSGDNDDYIYFDTFAANVPMISTGGDCDFVINASSGEISFGDENLTTTGTMTVPLVIGGTATTSDLSLMTTSGVGATGADMHFLVGSNGATEAMTILNNGYVGIGTDAPSSPLEVKGIFQGSVGGFASGLFHVTRGGEAEFANAVITGHNTYNTNTQLWYLGSTSGGNYDIGLLNRQDGDIRFHTNDAFRMVIDATGYIGIGTVIPPERLSIVGNIATGDTAAGDIDVFHYFSTDGSWSTEWLVWDDGDARFELSDDFYVAGNMSLTGSIAGYFDTAAVVDTVQGLMGTYVTDANLTDTLDSYFDTAAVVDTIQGLLGTVAHDTADVVRSEFPTPKYMFNLADPDGLYATDHEWSIDPLTERAITIDSFRVTLDADPTTELTFSLKFADAFIGFANAVVIDDTATVAGVTIVTGGFGDATVPANKCIYLLFDADPDDAITQASFKIYYSFD